MGDTYNIFIFLKQGGILNNDQKSIQLLAKMVHIKEHHCPSKGDVTDFNKKFLGAYFSKINICDLKGIKSLDNYNDGIN